MVILVRAIVVSTCLVAGLVAHAPVAFAGDQANDRVMAESLFDEGRKLLEDGKLDEACAKLDASNRMESAVGTLLNLGDCNERRGRLATAWSNYRAAASLAVTRGDAARADFARRRSDLLQPRLSTLTVQIAVPEPGLRVKRDGVDVDDAAWGTALPIDAGAHVIVAEAPGKASWSTSIVIADGDGQHSVVKVEPLAAAASAPVPAATTKDALAPRAPTPEPRATRTLGFVGIGAGALAIGAGVYFALHARSTWDDGEPHCDAANRCDDVGVALNRSARKSGDIATVAITSGLILAAAGVVAVLLSPSKTNAAATSRSVQPMRSRLTLRLDGIQGVFDVP